MPARVLCAFDSPASARAVVPSAVELASREGAALSFLAVLRPGRNGAAGPAASRAVRRRAFLEIALAGAAEVAGRSGRGARIGLVPAASVEREALGQALAEGASAVLVAEERGLRRRPRVARLTARRAGVPQRLRA